MTTITYTVYSAHLDVVTDEDAADYTAELDEALRKRWPDYEVTVNLVHDVSGVGSGVYVESDDGADIEQIERLAESLAESVWQHGDWIVSAPALASTTLTSEGLSGPTR